jgi:type IV secretory pathway VirB3-like protein
MTAMIVIAVLMIVLTVMIVIVHLMIALAIAWDHLTNLYWLVKHFQRDDI